MKRLWVVLALAACKVSNDDMEERRHALKSQFDEQFARYRAVIDAFLAATSAKDYGRAYDLLAPTYRNMVPREHFVARVATNHNFDKPAAISWHRYTSLNGTLKYEVTWGELGNAEVSFVNVADGSQAVPRIAAISINGTPALPSPP